MIAGLMRMFAEGLDIHAMSLIRFISVSYSTVVLHFRFLPSLFLSHYTNTESDVTRSPYLLKKFRFS